jgi:bisdemethoxycurcumin synthase
VQKRYLHHTEELLSAHPEFLDRSSPSLDARLDIVKTAVPELAAQACRKAIAEWGRPAADVTHLVVATNSGAHIPGVDFQLVSLLGLRPTVRRTMLYLNGCSAGAAALRLARDLAENNRGARVLVACAEITVLLSAYQRGYRGPLMKVRYRMSKPRCRAAVSVGPIPFFHWTSGPCKPMWQYQ